MRYDRAMRAIGIDVGGTSVKASLLEGDGATVRVVGSGRSAAYRRPDIIELRAKIGEAVRECVGAGWPSARVDAVGLCVPGRRDEAGRRVVASVNVPGLVGVGLQELVGESMCAAGVGAGLVGERLVVTSDAHAAAVDVAAGLAGGSRTSEGGPRRLLVLSLGTGVGACVLDGLVPLRVSGESPGHFGQIDVGVVMADGRVPVGPDGGRGGLEAYVGLPALVGRLSGPAETVMQRVGADDVALVAVARAIRIGHAVYRPHVVGLVGGVGIGLARHAAAIRAMVDDGLTSVAREGWALVFGVDGFHAARGAARVAMGGLGVEGS